MIGEFIHAHLQLVAELAGLFLVLGVVVGGGSALVAVLLTKGAASEVPWAGLALTLGAILLAGLLSSALSLRAALYAPLLPALPATVERLRELLAAHT